MGTYKAIILVAGIFFVSILLTGFWVRNIGTSYSSIILTIQKLISLAGFVVFGITIVRLNQANGLSLSAATAVVVTGVLFVFTVLSRCIWSIEKEMLRALVRLH